MVSKGDRLGGGGDALGLWDRNPIKLDCDDHGTTINVINSLSNKKRKKKKRKPLLQVKIQGVGRDFKIWPHTL